MQKILFIDRDGTLIDEPIDNFQVDSFEKLKFLPNAISFLKKIVEETDFKLVEKWERGEFGSFIELAERSVALLKRYGLTRDLFSRCLNGCSLNPGVTKTIQELQRRNIRTAIVSGGFYEQARKVQQELSINHSYAAVELFWGDTGLISHANLWPSDYVAKVDFVKLLTRESGFEMQETAYIGDGKNDVHVAECVGLSFAYRAHSKLKAVATHSIDDFDKILDFLD